MLALANVALAVSAFAEPILFGRIIDVLTRAQIPGTPAVTFTVLMPLIIAWVAFGFFSIGAGVLVALYADRLAHRRRLAVMANYFEHVLELPLAFHNSPIPGRAAQGHADRRRTACAGSGSASSARISPPSSRCSSCCRSACS